MKRLVICCDGTWQALGSPYPTNVVKLAQAIRPTGRDGVPQLIFYIEGLGTEGQRDRFLGGFLGIGIDNNIQDAYRFLCFNYCPGDEIYLFGFSRGAYTMRSLAGLIYCSGLLSRAHIRLIPQAYEWYRNHAVTPQHPDLRRFRRTYGARVPITLLGCWDTVGALGVPRSLSFLSLDEMINDRYQFHTTSLSPLVRYALHAVAIDERREVFSVTPMQQRQRIEGQVVRQVWFSGDHTGVGGGDEEKSGLSDETLAWMMQQISDFGVGLDLDAELIPTGLAPDHTIAFDNIPARLYRLTGQNDREIPDDSAQLHISVKRRWRDVPDYRPPNLVTKHQAYLDQWQEGCPTGKQRYEA